MITEIGELTEERESTEFYNGILVPGFVNSHCHLELSHLAGCFERGTGMAGFIRQINRLRNNTGKEERVKAMALQLDLLYKSGVSAMADISNCDESFDVKALSPLYTRTFLEVFGTEPQECENIMNTVRELTKKAVATGIDAAPTPHSCYTMSKQLIKASSADAISAGWLSYHNQESWEEEELIMSGNGPLAQEYKSRMLKTPPVTGKPALFYFLDILSDISQRIEANILLVHNTFTAKESINEAKVRVKGLYWAICPLSNLFIHNSLPPIELMRREGLKITLGTDSLSSNHILSIVEEIKCLQTHFPNVPLAEILEWSSFNGAAFLKKEDTLGSFEIGKKPGVVLIDNIDFNTFKLTTSSKSIRLV